MLTNFKQEFNSWSNAPVWICLLLNNTVAAFLLGITFLTGPPAHMPYWEMILRLASYVFIVSLIFSLITIGLLALFRRFRIGLQSFPSANGFANWSLFDSLSFYISSILV